MKRTKMDNINRHKFFLSFYISSLSPILCLTMKGPSQLGQTYPKEDARDGTVVGSL